MDEQQSESPPVKRPRRKKRWRRLVRWALIAACLMLLALIVTGIAARLYLSPKRTAELARAQIKRLLKQEPQIGEIDVGPIRGLRISDIVIADPSNPGGPPLIKLDQIVVRYSLSSLAHRTFIIDKVAVRGLHANLRQKDGVWNFEQLIPPSEPAPPKPEEPSKAAGMPKLPFAVTLSSLEVSDFRADVAIEDQITAGIDGLNVSMSAATDADLTDVKLRLRTSIDSLHAKLSDQPRVEVSFASDLSLQANPAAGDITKLDLSAAIGSMFATRVTGNARKLGEDKIELDCSTKIDLDAVLDLIQPLLPDDVPAVSLEGASDIRVIVAGALAQKAKSGNVSLKATVDTVIDEATVEEPEVHVKGLKTRVTADAAYSLEKGLGRSQVSVDVRLADAAAMAMAFVRDLETRVKVTVPDQTLANTSLHVDVSIGEAAAELPDLGRIATSIKTALDATADPLEGHVKQLQIDTTVGSFLHDKLKASISEYGRETIIVEDDVRIDVAAALALVPKPILDKLGPIEIAGEVRAQTSITGWLPDEAKKQKSSFSVESTITPALSGIQYARLPASVGEVQATVRAGAAYSMEEGLGPSTLHVETHARDVAALGKARVGSVEVTIDAKVEGQALRQAEVKVVGNVRGTEWKEADVVTRPLDVRCDLSAKADMKEGRVKLDRLAAELGDWLKLSVTATLEEWAKRFDTDLTIDVDLAGAVREIPDAIAKRLPPFELSGRERVKVTATGTMPTESDIKQLALPVNVTVRAETRGLHVSLPKEKLSVRADDDLTLSYSAKQIDVKNRLRVGELKFRDMFGDLPPKIDSDFSLKITDLDEAEVTSSIRLTDRGAKNETSVAVRGLSLFTRGRYEGKVTQILDGLSASLETRTELANDGKRPLLPGLTLKGYVGSRLWARLEAGKSVGVGVRTSIEGLGAWIDPDVEIIGLSGKLPELTKTYSLKPVERTALVRRSAPRSARDAFYASLRGYADERRNFSIKRVRLQRYEISDVAADLRLDDVAPQVEQFELSLLGGSIVGKLRTELGAEEQSLLVQARFGLNPKKVAPFLHDLPDEETEINGSFRFSVALRRIGDRAPGLNDIELTVNVTRIGAKALDRLLVYLDPDESQPAIQDARSKLKLGRPTRVLVEARYGVLTGTIWVQATVGPEIVVPLPEIPIAQVQALGPIAKNLGVLATVSDAVRKLVAQELVVDEKGAVTFR